MQGLTEEEEKRLILSVGTHRQLRPLSPEEVSALLSKAVGSGVSRKACAFRLGIGASQVASFLRLQELPSDVRHLATWGGHTNGVAFSSLALVAQLEGREAQRAAVSAILKHNLTWSETLELVQIARRSGSSVGAAAEQVVRRRPEVESRYIYIGSVLSARQRAQLSSMPQIARDRLIEQALAETGVPANVRGRLGVETFTLIAKEALATSRDEADAVEQRVNDALDRLVERGC